MSDPTPTTASVAPASRKSADQLEAEARAKQEREDHDYLKRAAPSDVTAAGVRNGMSVRQQVETIKAFLAAQS